MGRQNRRWRPLKEKTGRLDEWPNGWGDGLSDLDNGGPKGHFSLQAEARNTERRHHQRGSSTPRTRREPVQFVSVGSMNPDQSLKSLQVDAPPTPPINLGGLSQSELMSRLSIQELQPARSPGVASSRDPGAEIVRDPIGRKEPTSGGPSQSKVNNEIFSTNTVGAQKTICSGFPQQIIRSQSPSLSDSSDEVIVFAGRGQTGGAPLLNRGFSQGDRSLQRAHSTTNQGVPIREDPVDPTALAAFGDTGSTGTLIEGFDGLNHNTRGKSPKQRKRQMENIQLQAQAPEEEAIADYIANIDPTDIFPSKNETQDGFPRDVKTSGDHDGLGVLNMTEILSKRHNRSGTQYLVVEEDSSAALARGISVGSLNGAEEFRDEEGSSGSDNPGGDETQVQIAADLQGDLDDVLDEKDLWDRRVEGMTDEKIARLLSKQEELGLGSSELLLQDDTGEDENEEGLDEFVVPEKGTSSRARRNTYPNPIPEEFDANNYGTFDIMDLNRPSLRRLPKGRSRTAALGLDNDNELGSQMQVHWENDRSKKKIRKQEREELRAQGLLGQKSKVNAASEMSPDEIKMTIREFLLSSNPRLVLPPLGPRDRKMVHEIAHVLGLKSRSFGDDGARRPVLVKTDDVGIYDESVVDALERRFGFGKRKDKGLQTREPRSRNPRGGRDSRVTYQDGDIVGAAAPELGAENKGRAMLEKMGWSKGTALGAINNKGIMQPLIHVVRNSKAGLG